MSWHWQKSSLFLLSSSQKSFSGQSLKFKIDCAAPKRRPRKANSLCKSFGLRWDKTVDLEV